MFFVFEFLVELVEHAEEDDTDGDPLVRIDVMPEDEDTHNHTQHLPGGCHQRENVLLEVRHDVVDTYLSDHLQTSDPEDVDQRLGVVPDKGQRNGQGTIHQGLVADAEQETEGVGGREQLVGRGLESRLAVGLGV